MVNRQIKRDLPAQIEANGIHRTLIRKPVAIGEQQHLREQARRDRRTPAKRGITLREVHITHDPLTMLRQQRTKRVLRQQIRAPRRIEEAPLPIRYREHHTPQNSPELQGKCYAISRTDQLTRPPTFSVVFARRSTPATLALHAFAGVRSGWPGAPGA